MSFIIDIYGNKNVFIHIPKNGGISLINHLTHYFSINRGGSDLWNGPYTGHLTYIETKEMCGDTNYICIVRNPWARMVSFYRYIKERPPSWHGIELHDQLNNGMDFGNFIDVFVNSEHPIMKPQLWYMVNSIGEICVNEIFKLETLDDDLNAFLIKSNVNIEVSTVKPINQIDSNDPMIHTENITYDYKKYYTSMEMIDKVREFEKDIIKKFNYEF